MRDPSDSNSDGRWHTILTNPTTSTNSNGLMRSPRPLNWRGIPKNARKSKSSLESRVMCRLTGWSGSWWNWKLNCGSRRMSRQLQMNTPPASLSWTVSGSADSLMKNPHTPRPQAAIWRKRLIRQAIRPVPMTPNSQLLPRYREAANVPRPSPDAWCTEKAIGSS